ncbi:MAG TPA: hypothetical protein DGZ24_06015 [Rhodospirillaceae bacterium]|nr:hypothetical protein [Candidatus Neomarinimicrobiota bacterium]HCX14855.1 hypothetical protein [Rhodospirillaceae bacterium]
MVSKAKDPVMMNIARPKCLKTLSIITSCLFAAMAMFAADLSMAADEPLSSGGEPVVRRLLPDQYRNIVADVFGSDIEIGGRFEPDMRKEGLLAVGASKISVTGSGLAQYDAIARGVAEQAVDKRHRDLLMPCKPASLSEFDEVCARTALGRAGLHLYRRPLTDEELDLRVNAAFEATEILGDFYQGFALSLGGMLSSPQFLFRTERPEPDPDHPGHYRLDAYSKAERLSFFLWNTSPDTELLEAAASGQLHTEKGLLEQANRLLASSRVEDGVRAFFEDMLHFDRFATFSKDAAIYPKFTTDVTEASGEQTLRTIVDVLLTENGDYRDLFTTPKTFMNPLMGSVYGVPVPKITANGAPDPWVPYTYSENDPRAAGILMHASFTALHSHPGRTSPTLRGKAIREILMCQHVPDPPGEVEFTVVQDTDNPVYKTARSRLQAHATEPMCTGCHKITDPMGLAMENFDAAAGFRTTENGEVIDTSGSLDGREFANAVELGQVIADHPATTDCLVNRVYAYAAGRAPAKGEEVWMKYLKDTFIEKGHRFPDLMRTIVTSAAFYRVAESQSQEANAVMGDSAESLN